MQTHILQIFIEKIKKSVEKNKNMCYNKYVN